MSVCNIIRDLMPLFADKALSPDSRRVVREHLKRCPECRACFRQLRAAEPRPEREISVPELAYPALARRMRTHKTRVNLIGGGILAASMAVSLISLVLLQKDTHCTQTEEA